MNFNDVAIASVKGIDYRINFWYMSKDDAINIMNQHKMQMRKGVCFNFLKFLLGIKMSECNFVEKTYYQKNRDVILNRVKEYYENGQERLKEQARDKYRNLSEEEKK